MMAAAELRGTLLRDEPMACHTTWRVGGPAERYYRPADLEDLAAFLAGLPPEEPVYWVGLGSNLLVRDGGLRGTVIAPTGRLDRIERLEETGLRAEAGATCAGVARFAARAGLTGAEFLAGIPGTLGGALAMNAGAWGGETWALVRQVETLDRQGHRHLRDPGEFEIGYRHVAGPGDEWFVGAELELQPGDGESGRRRIKQLLAERAERQPTGQACCGSVFRNPEGDFAARLIESCGLKGMRLGGAQVSEKHANFIINTGEATAADIEALIERVRNTVAEQTGIRLQTEVKIVGEPA